MLDAVPQAPATVVVVEAAKDHAPLIMLGFVATGTEAQMTSLETEAAKKGISTGRTKGPNERPEVMVGFKADGSRASRLDLYHAALAGKFGKMKIEVALLPVEAAKAGKGVSAATIEDPEFIVDPKS